MEEKKKPLESLKEGEEITSLTNEELQRLRVKLSIEVPKEAFDELLKAMMGKGNTDKINND